MVINVLLFLFKVLPPRFKFDNLKIRKFKAGDIDSSKPSSQGTSGMSSDANFT